MRCSISIRGEGYVYGTMWGVGSGEKVVADLTPRKTVSHQGTVAYWLVL